MTEDALAEDTAALEGFAYDFQASAAEGMGEEDRTRQVVV